MSLPHKPAGPGRPARITRRMVAEAALAVGLDRVTLAEVGRHLGVDHSSLYRHTSGRADMLQAAADIAIASLDWEKDTEDWRLYLESAADAIWSLFDRHPGLANALRQLETMPASGGRAFCRACRRLETFGFTAEQGVLIMDSIMDLTIDAACYSQRLREQSAHGGTVADRIGSAWDDLGASDPVTAAHMALMRSAILGNSKQWWRRKLDLLLDGAAALLATGDGRCRCGALSSQSGMRGAVSP